MKKNELIFALFEQLGLAKNAQIAKFASEYENLPDAPFSTALEAGAKGAQLDIPAVRRRSNFPEVLYAKQSSQFSRSVYNLSKLAQEILLMAIGTFAKVPKKNLSVEFSISEFARTFEKKDLSTTQFHQQVFNAVNELLKVICYEDVEQYLVNSGGERYKGTMYTLFKIAYVDTGKNIKLTFNEFALKRIQEIYPYEVIEFSKVAKLQGKHAFNIYKYALSKQGFSGKQGNRQKNWWFEISVDLLKLYLGVSAKDYKQISDFQRRCIRDPIDEINNAEIGIKIAYSAIFKGRCIVAFHFDCFDTSLENELQSEFMSDEQRKALERCSAEDRFIQKYSREFKKLFEAERQAKDKPFDSAIFQKARALAKLIQIHPRTAKRFGLAQEKH